ncbi:MAG: RDD family protein [Steroidobacteraceae bacterium]
MATIFFSCSHCGHQASTESKFCPSCGTAAVRAPAQADAGAAAARPNAGAVAPPPPFNATRLCGQCGTEFGTGGRYCPQCGAPAGGAPASSGPAPGAANYGAAPGLAGPGAANYGAAPGPAGYGAAPHAVANAGPQYGTAPFLCGRCGAQIAPGTNFCPRCGNSATGAPAASAIAYAGFGVRFVADLIDTIIMAVIFVLFIWLPIANIGISFAAMCLYGALTESSTHQATLGKRAMGLKVTDLEGKRISFGRGLGRYFLKELFSLSLVGWLTFLVILFTNKKQGVHDLMAGTLVWKTR